MAATRSRGNAAAELRLIAPSVPTASPARHRQQPVFGKTDFLFPARKLAVFVDGCFWHGCPLHATQPKTNADFWREKLAANRTRDRLVTSTLRARGWRVVRIWEHELARKNENRLLRRLRAVNLVGRREANA